MGKEFVFDPGVGVAATYWEIIGYSVDYFQRVLQVTVGGWVSREARESNLQPLCSHTQEFSQLAVDEGSKEWLHARAQAELNNVELSRKPEDYTTNLRFDFGKTIKEKELWERLEKTTFFYGK